MTTASSRPGSEETLRDGRVVTVRPHKSDVGGVALGITTPQAAAKAVTAISGDVLGFAE